MGTPHCRSELTDPYLGFSLGPERSDYISMKVRNEAVTRQGPTTTLAATACSKLTRSPLLQPAFPSLSIVLPRLGAKTLLVRRASRCECPASVSRLMHAHRVGTRHSIIKSWAVCEHSAPYQSRLAAPGSRGGMWARDCVRVLMRAHLHVASGSSRHS